MNIEVKTEAVVLLTEVDFTSAVVVEISMNHLGATGEAIEVVAVVNDKTAFSTLTRQLKNQFSER